MELTCTRVGEMSHLLLHSAISCLACSLDTFQGRTELPAKRGSTPGWGMIFLVSFPRFFFTCLWTPTSVIFSRAWGYSSRFVKSTKPQMALMLRVSGYIPPLPHKPSWCAQGQLPLHLIPEHLLPD